MEFDFSLPGYSFLAVFDQKESRELTPKLYSDWLLRVSDLLVGSGVKEAIELIQQGLNYIMDASLLRMFSIDEIDKMIYGEDPKWTEDDIESIFVFDLSIKSSELIRWFKEIVQEMTSLQREQFIMFITGQRRIHRDDITITVEVSGNDDTLPTSMTCVNLLRLPCYVCTGRKNNA